MILESATERDARFLARAIRENGLSPWPVREWLGKFPSGWSDGLRTVNLEWYPWGVVAFVADGNHPAWASTLVMVGRVDWEAGTVTDGGAVDLIPIPWFGDVRLEGVGSMETDDTLPTCLSYHEHCPTCDGGANAAGVVEAVCLWRARCYALKLHLAVTGQTVDAFVEEFPDQVALHARLAEIEREKVASIPPPAVPIDATIGEAKGTLTRKKKGKKRFSVRWNKKIQDPLRFAKLEPLVKAFLARLKKGLTRLGYGWVARRSLAMPGNCYVNRVTKRSNYLTVYVASKRRYAKVAIVRMKPLLACIDVGHMAEFQASLGVKGTVLKPAQSALTRSEWQGIKDRKTARLAAKVLVRMVRKGMVKLPPPASEPRAES